METIYCEFEDPKRYREAVALARRRQAEGDVPRESGSPRRAFTSRVRIGRLAVRSCNPDGFLVRNYDHLRFFAGSRLIGDYP